MMSEEKYDFEVMDEVVFNNLKDAEKFEVVSVSNRGFTLGVKPSKGFHKARTQTVDASTAIKTGVQVDRTSLLDLLSVPKQK
tara:strand:+ start:261 stop:506 length:246 start_codon:yes stop_codon:yes gene_type:complete